MKQDTTDEEGAVKNTHSHTDTSTQMERDMTQSPPVCILGTVHEDLGGLQTVVTAPDPVGSTPNPPDELL